MKPSPLRSHAKGSAPDLRQQLEGVLSGKLTETGEPIYLVPPNTAAIIRFLRRYGRRRGWR